MTPGFGWEFLVEYYPAGNIKPDKEKSTEKIDGVVATIMALDRALKDWALPSQSAVDWVMVKVCMMSGEYC